MTGLFAILSPAKTLDMEADATTCGVAATKPRLTSQTKVLAKELRDYSPKRLESLMSVSTKLAQLNAERWKAFGARSNTRGSAAICFRGDVYQGLEAWTMKPASFKWAQERLRILSGLYGILRPLDVIQPYRLEMGTKLKTNEGSNLYTFWGNQIAKILRKDINDAKAKALVNLASDEYSKAAHLNELDVPVIDVKFLQIDKGKAKFMSFYAKRSRGLMARWMADTRPKSVEELASFDVEGYSLRKSESTDNTLVFTRAKPTPLSAKAG